MKNLPNILSITRLAVSGLLFFLGGYPSLFTILYLYCGISDVADGYIARRYKAESAMGAMLDTLGDVAMYLLIVFVFFSQTTIFSNTFALVLLLAIIAFKMINLLLTKLKFGLWGVIHTIAYKVIGFLVYISLPLYYLYSNLSIWFMLIICILALLAAMEETIMIITGKEYDINRRSIFDKIQSPI